MLTTKQLDRLKEITKTDLNTNWTHVAVGTGTTAPTEADTALEAEVLRRAREEITQTDTETTVSMWIPSTDANGDTLSEVGVFDASSGGNMFSRSTFDPITKTSDMEIWIDIKITNDLTING